MTRAAAEQFIRSLKDIGYTAILEHVGGDTYSVRIHDEIQLTIRTPKQARFALKYLTRKSLS